MSIFSIIVCYLAIGQLTAICVVKWYVKFLDALPKGTKIKNEMTDKVVDFEEYRKYMSKDGIDKSFAFGLSIFCMALWPAAYAYWAACFIVPLIKKHKK